MLIWGFSKQIKTFDNTELCLTEMGPEFSNRFIRHIIHRVRCQFSASASAIHNPALPWFFKCQPSTQDDRGSISFRVPLDFHLFRKLSRSSQPTIPPPMSMAMQSYSGGLWSLPITLFFYIWGKYGIYDKRAKPSMLFTGYIHLSKVLSLLSPNIYKKGRKNNTCRVVEINEAVHGKHFTQCPSAWDALRT